MHRFELMRVWILLSCLWVRGKLFTVDIFWHRKHAPAAANGVWRQSFHLFSHHYSSGLPPSHVSVACIVTKNLIDSPLSSVSHEWFHLHDHETTLMLSLWLKTNWSIFDASSGFFQLLFWIWHHIGSIKLCKNLSSFTFHSPRSCIRALCKHIRLFSPHCVLKAIAPQKRLIQRYRCWHHFPLRLLSVHTRTKL